MPDDCGCHVGEHDSLVLCEGHWIARGEFAFLHVGWDGHEECCDLPSVRHAVEDFGREAVEHAVTLMTPREQEYVGRVLAMVGDG